MKIQANKKHFKGFTLVELIIVITILGILATIAYISFQGYTKDARDGVRMSDIKQIYNGLSIYKTQTEKTLLPDNYINIQSGTTTISYQGYAGASVLRTLKISGGKDPGTKDYYIYTTDVNTKKAQLMTYMETSDKDVQLLGILKNLNVINQANAVTNTGYYQDKKIYVYGDKIGILTYSNKVPLQETTSSTGIDITSLTGNITTYFGGTIYNSGTSTSTGQTLVNQIVGAINNTKVCDTGYSLIGGNCVAQNIDIANSLRFDSSRSTYLSRTPGFNGSKTTWTYSTWLKGGLTNMSLFAAGDGSQTNGGNGGILVGPSGNLIIFNYYGVGTQNWDRTYATTLTNPTSWYHVVIVSDLGNADTNEMIRLYINGVKQTNFTQTRTPASNNWGWINSSGIQHKIGRQDEAGGPTYGNQYLSEINFIDGSAYGPENFGINIGGKWLPKKYEGTYGTNGFHLDFSNSGNLGDDVAGSNDWSISPGVQVIDQMIDTPTNNFSNFNPSKIQLSGSSSPYSASIVPTLSEGNTKFYVGTSPSSWSNPTGISTSLGISSGNKIYYEYSISWPSYAEIMSGIGNFSDISKSNAGTQQSPGFAGMTSTSFGLFAGYDGAVMGGKVYSNSSLVSGWSTGSTVSNGMVAVDTTNNKLWFGVNGIWLNNSDPSIPSTGISITSGETYYPWFSSSTFSSSSTATTIINFGQGGQSSLNWCPNAGGYFKNCPPAGFKTLSSKNIGN